MEPEQTASSPGPLPSTTRRKGSGNSTAFGCLALLALLAYWAGSYQQQSRPRRNPREAVPWLVVATVVFGVRAIAERFRK